MMPAEERMDLHVHPALKSAVLRLADEAGQSLNEWVSAALCGVLGVEPGRWPIPRKRPGRRAGRPAGKNSGKKAHRS
jgi:hypothetical protein